MEYIRQESLYTIMIHLVLLQKLKCLYVDWVINAYKINST
jgi:hypothetical protein